MNNSCIRSLIRIVLLFALQFDLLPLLSMLESSFGQGKGVTCQDFRYRHVAGVPGPHPIHKKAKGKKKTRSYTYHSENCIYSYTIFHNYTYSSYMYTY